ncbi:DUF4192 domain-containing protein [Cellulomonas sp. KRMCY2]|uniref:DUF4192 domain-containing protein n=1 Tax=Cellulomonas sp. KRMCY2 TaxID=1304865 RepID=UPI00045E82D1|nr:DUF4192 domain-containing protein [Cellulomonas sp. KRMCY2]
MQPTTIRTGEPRELLALIPFQLGFEPRESAVVVSLRSPRSRVGLVARVDLADLADPDRGPQVARSLVSHLVADGARRAVLVLYTAADLQDGPGTGQGRTAGGDPGADGGAGSAQAVGADGGRARLHLAAAAEYFLGEVTVWVVGPGGYFGLDCQDRRCCPPGGRPLSDLQATEVGARMVLTGATVAGSRADLGAIAPASSAARRSARRAAARWTARGCGIDDGADSADLYRWRRDGLALWRSELGRAGSDLGPAPHDQDAVGVGAARGPRMWQPPGPAVLGRLQAALVDILVRDAVMLGFVEGSDRVADRLIAGDGGQDVGRALAAIIDPVAGRPPSPGRSAAARAVLEQVVAHSPRRAQAPAATLLAVLAWWEGDGARAGVLVGRALEAEPGYRLAALLDEALAVGMSPGWLRAGVA